MSDHSEQAGGLIRVLVEKARAAPAGPINLWSVCAAGPFRAPLIDMDITQMIGREVDTLEIERALDMVSHPVRIEAIDNLGKSELARLFEASSANGAASLDDLVPRAIAPMQEVVHDGKNSLALFRRFRKRFCRPESDGVLWGYNDQAMSWAVGPGYFTAYSEDGRTWLDYIKLPSAHPAGWPDVRSNNAGLSRFVYGQCRDEMRRVSNTVSIGRVYRDHKPIDVWFCLVRSE